MTPATSVALPNCYCRQQTLATTVLCAPSGEQYVAGTTNRWHAAPRHTGSAPAPPTFPSIPSRKDPCRCAKGSSPSPRSACWPPAAWPPAATTPRRRRRPDAKPEDRRHPARQQAPRPAGRPRTASTWRRRSRPPGVEYDIQNAQGDKTPVPDHRRPDDHQRRHRPDDRQPGLRHRQGRAGQGRGRRASPPSTTTGSPWAAPRTTTSASTTWRSASCRARAWSSA